MEAQRLPDPKGSVLVVISFYRVLFHEHLQSSLKKDIHFFESTSYVEEFHSLTAQCVKNHLPLFILNLHHLNITWLPLALVLEGVLDSWSLLPLSTQLLLYACITYPLSCIFHRLKTPSLSSSFYKITSLPLIILTTSVPFPFYYTSSDPDQLEPQRAFIRQTNMHQWHTNVLSIYKMMGGLGCRKSPGQDSGRRKETVQCQNLALENSCARAKSIFRFANR